ncbi:DUF2235 domain-containing protein [Pseudovibrio sp. Alg231-02]|uniref:DUF2235 domain-containing protein n=1 Tax=Pseudovibrio sp. Alg231-02 TaxID=1922223 RepID=UPI000D550BAE|nr:DUF2235 domain-containing protein [Pseudovibrio sp. Alg231-02]
MSKNIVVLSDGTGQEGGVTADSNIYRLFKMAENRTKDQIIFYDRGLGTSGSGGLVSRKLGSLTGFGIQKNILECYRFIFDNFEAGDKIYLFGFSRGAATVRSLSGFLHLFGILPKSRPELIQHAYEIYKIKDNKKRETQAKEFRQKHHNMWCTVEFLGVWDTVPALGAPIKALSYLLNVVPWFRHNFHDFTLSASVNNAYHAVAIDDERKAFHPRLWKGQARQDQKMRQVWFSGMHSDVGGGYDDSTLARVSLDWMHHYATQCGFLTYDGVAFEKKEVQSNPLGQMHNSRRKWWERLFYIRKERSLPKDIRDIELHSSVIKRHKELKNYNPWILQSSYTVTNEKEEAPTEAA